MQSLYHPKVEAKISPADLEKEAFLLSNCVDGLVGCATLSSFNATGASSSNRLPQQPPNCPGQLHCLACVRQLKWQQHFVFTRVAYFVFSCIRTDMLSDSPANVVGFQAVRRQQVNSQNGRLRRAHGSTAAPARCKRTDSINATSSRNHGAIRSTTSTLPARRVRGPRTGVS